MHAYICGVTAGEAWRRRVELTWSGIKSGSCEHLNDVVVQSPDVRVKDFSHPFDASLHVDCETASAR